MKLGLNYSEQIINTVGAMIARQIALVFALAIATLHVLVAEESVLVVVLAVGAAVILFALFYARPSALKIAEKRVKKIALMFVRRLVLNVPVDAPELVAVRAAANAATNVGIIAVLNVAAVVRLAATVAVKVERAAHAAIHAQAVVYGDAAVIAAVAQQASLTISSKGVIK